MIRSRRSSERGATGTGASAALAPPRRPPRARKSGASSGAGVVIRHSPWYEIARLPSSRSLHFHVRACPRPTVWAGQELQPMTAKAHGVIHPDRPLILETEERLEIDSRLHRPVAGSFLCRWYGEAPVEIGAESGQTGGRFRFVRRPGQPQHAGQAVLQRAEQPLNTPFRLRRAGRNRGDCQFVE